MLVVYGGMAGISVGKLFAAAMVPGLLLSSLYLAYIAVRCGIDPTMGPPLPREERIYSAGQKLGMVLVSLVPPAVLIIMVLGSIVAAVATPTEAAAIGCAGSFLLAVLYRKLTWSAVKDAAIATVKTNAMVMTLFIGGNAFQSVFMGLGGGDAISNLILGVSVSPYVVLFIMMSIVFFLGMFIDWLGILLIVLPIFTPIAAEIGFNPVWFATLICVNLQMAFLTPPFGYSLFYLKGIAPEGLLVCIMYPDLVLWLPRLLFGVGSI
jgi:tripartite ATP-independent transporter DctM subunit